MSAMVVFIPVFVPVANGWLRRQMCFSRDGSRPSRRDEEKSHRLKLISDG
jgi:hypothetical protein